MVSACLLGHPARYDGGSRPCQEVLDLATRFDFIPICPESLGGLPIPRTPSEIDTRAGTLRVMSADGEDRTAAFLEGSRRCVELARRHGCTFAILKAKSPSCGSSLIYDGTFSGTLVPGRGVAAGLLSEAGVQVISEEDVRRGGVPLPVNGQADQAGA